MGNAIPTSENTPYEVVATLVLDTFILLFVWALVGRYILKYSDPSAPTVFPIKKKDLSLLLDEEISSLKSQEMDGDNIELLKNDGAELTKRLVEVTEVTAAAEDQSSVTSKDSNGPISNSFHIRKLSSSDERSNDNSSQDSRQRKPPPKKKSPPSRSSRFVDEGNGLTNKFELSKEEREMNGAPEGELFVTVALSRNDLTPYPPSRDGKDDSETVAIQSFAKALVILSEKDLKSIAWNVLFDAVSTLRVALIHYRGVEEMHLEEALPLTVPAIVAAARNSRSVLSKVRGM